MRRVDLDAPVLQRQAELLDDRVRGGADRDDQRVGVDPLAAFEGHVVGGGGRQSGAEPDLDAALLQLAMREAGQALRDLGQDALAGVEQDRADVARLDDRVALALGLPHVVVELGRDLDAGVAAAGHHERQHPPAVLGIGGVLGGLQHLQRLCSGSGGRRRSS